MSRKEILQQKLEELTKEHDAIMARVYAAEKVCGLCVDKSDIHKAIELDKKIGTITNELFPETFTSHCYKNVEAFIGL